MIFVTREAVRQWLCHSWKLLKNRFTGNRKIVIQVEPYMFLDLCIDYIKCSKSKFVLCFYTDVLIRRGLHATMHFSDLTGFDNEVKSIVAFDVLFVISHCTLWCTFNVLNHFEIAFYWYVWIQQSGRHAFYLAWQFEYILPNDILCSHSLNDESLFHVSL